jgi:hypothetical protein
MATFSICQGNEADDANNTSYKLSYSKMLRHYGAALWSKFLREVVHGTISCVFLHASACPAMFAEQPHSAFTAKFAQQAVQVIP